MGGWEILRGLYDEYRSGNELVYDRLVNGLSARLARRLRVKGNITNDLEENCHDAVSDALVPPKKEMGFHQAWRYAVKAVESRLIKRSRKARRMVPLEEEFTIDPDRPTHIGGLAIDAVDAVTTFQGFLRKDEDVIVFRSLVNGSPTLGEIVRSTGLSASTVKRRRHDMKRRFEDWLLGGLG